MSRAMGLMMNARRSRAPLPDISSTRDQRVVVIGAGVSGCSAALALASSGVPVLLLNSGLDSVGLPGYGPVVTAGATSPAEADDPVDPSDPKDVLEALREAAPALGDVWLTNAWTWNAVVGDAAGPEVPKAVIIDRRSVSLGTKWRVENERLIEIRQGLAVSVEAQGETGIVVRTVFGEELCGRVALVTVGLALGGRIRVGAQEMAGGRYGEVAADALLDDLSSQGCRFDLAEKAVGARVQSVQPARTRRGGSARPPEGGSARVAAPRASLVEVGLTPLAATEEVGVHDMKAEGEALCRPPSPYEGAEKRAPRVAYAVRMGSAPCADPADSAGPEKRSSVAGPLAVIPDGIVTGEWYVAPGFVEGAAQEPVVDQLRMGAVTRPAHVARGFVASGGEGKILPGVWVAGQASGASGYVGSLSSGRRIGVAIAEELLRDEIQS
ncbi:MAG: FAD-dependent oxidoreductase [Thermoleophilia bacterium]